MKIILKKLKNQKMQNKEFYTAKELADKFQVNIMTIYRYIKAKKLKAYKIGKEFRIDKVEFNRFLNSVKTK
jgi:excisionase family DNA binding protein